MSHVRRKLIEVALPLDAINRESARDSATLLGHPWNLHYWWARRKLPVCRAVLFAQLVDDPSSRPDRFPTEDDQRAERKRLFDIIERLVVWENMANQQVLREAHAEIAACFDGDVPTILDPFAGGGSIPLEAQRLGLRARASDLNPIPVLINKALIEIPPHWTGRTPVWPGSAESKMGAWPGASGLAHDVREYGMWMHREALGRIGKHYPEVRLPDGTTATAVAWLWARTVRCPNPGCGAEMPLISTLWLSKKKERPTWLRPIVVGNRVSFDVVIGKEGPPDPPKVGRGAKFVCLVCGDNSSESYIKAEGMANRVGTQLLAVVAEGKRQRVYVAASAEQEQAAQVERPDDVPTAELAQDPRNIWCVSYGLTKFSDLFTARQLQALTTFSDLVHEAGALVATHAKSAGMAPADATEYGRSVATYLAMLVDKAADNWSSIASWHAGNGQLRNVFARQAIPMVWDFAEANPFVDASVGWSQLLGRTPEAIARLGHGPAGSSIQESADRAEVAGVVVSTDPPYYDNVAYADLSDFFYVWLRRSLRDLYPDVLGTVQTPKTEEMVATPYRFGGSKRLADDHFESGFVRTFTRIRESHHPDVPSTVYYAFKQSEADEGGTASTGWETMLNGLNEAGLMVTATWPVRTERATRMLASGTNALASSIVLACRPRPESAQTVNRRGFIAALQDELPTALRALQQGSVAPVDLAQAAIGPGMAVFTRYRSVVEADGSSMSVRTALALINQVLDEVLSEQEGDLNSDSRFAVAWFTQHGWNEGESGMADQLARAKNTSVEGVERAGIFRARAGKARLLGLEDLTGDWHPDKDDRISEWEVTLRVAKALAEGGVDQAGPLLAACGRKIELDNAKELAYLLFALCERKGWTQSAILFNAVGSAWADLLTTGRKSLPSVQSSMQFEASEDA